MKSELGTQLLAWTTTVQLGNLQSLMHSASKQNNMVWCQCNVYKQTHELLWNTENIQP